MDLLYFCSVFCFLCLCARLFICALWPPAGKGLTSWLSFVVSNCEFVTFPLVSWVRCGTLLYRFVIFAPLLTLSKVSTRCIPRNLNMQDRQQRVESSQELLEVYNANPEDFHTRLVIGDENWLHHWDPDTKKRVNTMVYTHLRNFGPSHQPAR